MTNFSSNHWWDWFDKSSLFQIWVVVWIIDNNKLLTISNERLQAPSSKTKYIFLSNHRGNSFDKSWLFQELWFIYSRVRVLTIITYISTNYLQSQMRDSKHLHWRLQVQISWQITALGGIIWQESVVRKMVEQVCKTGKCLFY